MTGDPDRALILERIARVLEGAPRGQRRSTAEPEVDARPANRIALAQMFRSELALLGGEARFVASEGDLPGAIAALVEERELGAASMDYATAGYALLRAEALVADTGSAIVIERSAERRLAPYLPRTCIIVADSAALHPALTEAAMASVHAAARAGDRGEAVIITGPSRTADIEKTIVLGAHGPKDLVVFIVGVAPDATERG